MLRSRSTKLNFREWSLSRSIEKFRRCVVAVAALLFLTVVAQAQTTASLSGTVKDVTGALVAGSRIELTNEESKAQWHAKSNGEGFFNFAAIMPATYSLTIIHPGFESWVVTGIVIHPGDSLTVPKITLKVGRAEVSVTVTADTAGVTLDTPEHSTLINADDIKRLSTQGRDVAELLTILPGFSANAGADIQNEGPGGLYGYQTMGFGNGQVSNLSANGAAPQQGLVNINSDGANIIDPGDMGGQVSNINMDQVQEVKVETSNFGADQAKGPVVVNAVGKSGGTQFHGGLYTYFRNSALNSNDWLSKYYGSSRPELQYFYPGGTLGGPVLIPHTHFNAKKRLVFWAGFEYYGQNASQALLTAFVPNAAMLGGDLSTNTLANALNVSSANLAANCPADYSVTNAYTNVGGMCYSPNGSLDQTGAPVTNGQMKNIDPGAKAIASLWPAANRTPQPVYLNGTLQYATDGINYTKNIMATHNGLQLHTRIDENFTDTLKLAVTYNWEKINDESPTNNIYYNPNGTVPYPTPEYSHGDASYLTLDLTKTVGSSLTNDLVVSGVYYYQPKQFANPAAAQSTGTAWAAAGYASGNPGLGLKETQWPEIINYETQGLPSLSFGYVPPTSEFLRKFDWNISDSITKVYKTHTFKVGAYFENTGNNNATLGSLENGQLTFMRWDSCYPNQPLNTTPPLNPANPPATANMGNVIGNFLMGCPLAYQQANGDPTQDLRFRTIEGFITDEWKLTSKLTLTLGVRLSHLEPWTDAHGVGLAVWNPSTLTPHVLVNNNLTGSTEPANAELPGITWHALDSQYPVAGVPTRTLFYGPRGGLAYDLYGDGKTVFRGGWGMYYSHDSASIAGGALATAIGLKTFGTPGNVSCTFGQLFTSQYEPCGFYSPSPSSLTPFVASAMNPKDDRMPVTYNYNFTLDQRGPWKSMFEIAYVGNQGHDLSTLGNLQNQNVIPLGAEFLPDPVTGVTYLPANIPNKADYRPYPNYQQVDVPNHLVWSNYNSLQTSWNRQSGSFVYGANYTWSKAMGVRGNYDTGNIGDPIDPRHDYGILSLDRPQAFNLTYSYQEGKKYKGNPLLGQVLNNWEISGIATMMSGPDLANLNGSTNFGLSGGVNYTTGGSTVGIPVSSDEWLGSSDYSLQPTITCDPRHNLQKDQFANGNCFALPAVGTQGWWNLPDVHGPAYFKWDMSVYKNFTISDRQNIQFRVSGFNFLNHPLTSFANNNLGSLDLVAGNCSSTATVCPTYSTPGQAIQNAVISNAGSFAATPFRNGVRILELALKYNF